MSILELLASSQGLKGNEANITLAKELASSENHKGIKELVANLVNKDMRIQSDCIKTLYETGYIKPELIADYYADFLKLLTNKNNRLVWGSMIALSAITEIKKEEIFNDLDLIMETVNKGSVITIDCGVEILAKLNANEEYFNTIDPLLAEQLWKCPVKQLPQYLEKSLVCINNKNREIYQDIIDKRLPECEKNSQIKRLEKIRKQIEAITP